MARKLTEQQQKFLDALFDQAAGSVAQAKKLAGYSDTTSTTYIVYSLKEEILDAVNEFLDTNILKRKKFMMEI